MLRRSTTVFVCTLVHTELVTREAVLVHWYSMEVVLVKAQFFSVHCFNAIRASSHNEKVLEYMKTLGKRTKNLQFILNIFIHIGKKKGEWVGGLIE